LQKGRESSRGWADTLKLVAQKGFIAVDCDVVDWALAPRSAALAVMFCLSVPAVAGAQDAPIVLAPHRAVYDLTLEQTRGNSQVASVSGRIVYDFSGSACEGYSLDFRQVSALSSGEGEDKDSTSDQRSTTWEDAAAKSFKFTSQNYVNDKLIDAVDGHAERGATAIAVDLEKPDHKELSFDPKVVFPTEHMVRAIAAARAGKSLLDFPVYDGSESGEKIFDTLTVIGRKIEAGERQHDDAAANEPKLANVARWPVTISYFNRSKKEDDKEQTPAYAIGFELYDNGISRALTLDYNDFVVSGKLSSLEFKEQKPCP
jgi:EipB-like